MPRATVEDWTEAFLARVHAHGDSRSAVDALQRLRVGLTAVMGYRGTDALIGRAVHIAQRGGAAPPAELLKALSGRDDVGAALQAADPATADAMATAIAGQLLAVVAGIIGDELTRSLLARMASPSPSNPTRNSGR